ncbi:hypothetical protein DENSPDRAFT_163244 [Dentipellis sp. KUC8613]|nr:hypothetical protein DENSPDRAFT_163244 [Dentipellis sp. KUC8613]
MRRRIIFAPRTPFLSRFCRDLPFLCSIILRLSVHRVPASFPFLSPFAIAAHHLPPPQLPSPTVLYFLIPRSRGCPRILYIAIHRFLALTRYPPASQIRPSTSLNQARQLL